MSKNTLIRHEAGSHFILNFTIKPRNSVYLVKSMRQGGVLLFIAKIPDKAWGVLIVFPQKVQRQRWHSSMKDFCLSTKNNWPWEHLKHKTSEFEIVCQFQKLNTVLHITIIGYIHIYLSRIYRSIVRRQERRLPSFIHWIVSVINRTPNIVWHLFSRH